MIKNNFNIEVVKDFLKDAPKNSKIYIGSDSTKIKKKRIRFATVIAIHTFNESGIGQGAKVFGEINYENDIDGNAAKPFNRMISETTRVVELFKSLKKEIGNKYVELHVDINPNKEHGSSVAYNAAKGYIKGMTGIDAKFKPEAFCASFAADKFCST